MKRFIPFFFVYCFFSTNVSAQKNNVQTDSLTNIIAGEKIEPVQKGRKFVPKRAAMFSAAFPGLGQAYNRKYWKIPILYAGIAATAWGINWNNTRYSLYRNAYIDLMDSDPNSKRYLDIPSVYTREELEDRINANPGTFETTFEKRRDSYRRDRDLLIIVMVGVYVINIIDANVDAHLADFDVSNDLTMNVSPTLMGSLADTGNPGVGLSLKIKF